MPDVISVRAMNTKTLNARVIPVSTRLALALQVIYNERSDDGLVFGISDNFTRSWRTACKLAGIEGLRFHDLRDVCNSPHLRWYAGCGSSQDHRTFEPTNALCPLPPRQWLICRTRSQLARQHQRVNATQVASYAVPHGSKKEPVNR